MFLSDSWPVIRARLEHVPARWYAAPTIGIAIGIALSTIALWSEIWYERGTDYGFMIGHTRQWLDGGGFHLPEQLAGPYDPSAFNNYYPPPALLLFLPFTFLPGPLWWALPLGVITWLVLSSRPAPWSWPILPLLCWATDAVDRHLGQQHDVDRRVRRPRPAFAWPSILVLIKPYFAQCGSPRAGRLTARRSGSERPRSRPPPAER